MIPTRKVGAGIGIGTAIAIFSSWLAISNGWIDPMPDQVLVAWGGICSFVMAWLMPDK